MNRQQGGITLQTILALVGLAALAWVFGPALLQWAQAQGGGATAVTVQDGAAIIQPIQPINQAQPPAVGQPIQPIQPTPTLAANAPEARPTVNAAQLARLDQQIGQAARVVVECRAVQVADPYNNYHCERPQAALETLRAMRAELTGQ